MSKPTPSDVHVDSALTQISIAFLQNASNFAARSVFPVVPVMHKSDEYYTYSREDFNRDEAQVRAPGAESAGSGFDTPTTSYTCKVWAHHKDLDDQTLSNADQVLDLEDAAANFVMHKLLIRQEREWASTYMTGGVWDNDFDGVASSPSSIEAIQWSDDTSGDPIGNIRDAKNTILGNTGIEPNVLVLGHDVYTALVDHPDIVDRIKYSGGVGNGNPARVNEQTMAALFDLDRIVVSKAVYNSANEGSTESSSFIVGKDALLCYAPPAPGLMTPAAGYTFSWDRYLNQSNGLGVATSRIDLRPTGRRVTRIEGEIAMDMKLVSSALGFFWDGIVA